MPENPALKNEIIVGEKRSNRINCSHASIEHGKIDLTGGCEV